LPGFLAGAPAPDPGPRELRPCVITPHAHSAPRRPASQRVVVISVDDAAAMLRTCLAAADIDWSVCVFLEPIARYHTRDLYEPGDGGWC
jgi:hypothetical protein